METPNHPSTPPASASPRWHATHFLAIGVAFVVCCSLMLQRSGNRNAPVATAPTTPLAKLPPPTDAAPRPDETSDVVFDDPVLQVALRAVARCSPTNGSAPLTVRFIGRGASSESVVVGYRWDFDADGTYDDLSFDGSEVGGMSASLIRSDTVGIAKDFRREFRTPGKYTATLEVTDSLGNKATDRCEFEVIDQAAFDSHASAQDFVSLHINNDTICVEDGRARSVITTTLKEKVGIRILVKNERSETVRTLVDEQRSKGEHSDTWNGLDDSGAQVPHGPYFVIVECNTGREILVLDLEDTTGGEDFLPYRTPMTTLWGQPGFSFDPLAGKPLEIEFRVNPTSVLYTVDDTFVTPYLMRYAGPSGPAEIEAFVGLLKEDVRLATVTQRVPFGSNATDTHKITWDGLNAEGQLAMPPTGDNLLVGIVGYTFPDNTIFVRSAPRLSNVSVHPPVFRLIDNKVAQVAFDIDRQATVRLSVISLSSQTVVRRITKEISGGQDRKVAWDGRSSDGILAAPGLYRVGLQAVDDVGSASLLHYVLLQTTF